MDNLFEPKMDVAVDDKRIIKVEFSGEEAPYSAFGKYYLRTADEDREVTPNILKQFFIANKYKEQWEKSCSKTKAKQCDKETIKAFVNKAITAGKISATEKAFNTSYTESLWSG